MLLPDYGTSKERADVPSSEAYALYDRLEHAVSSIVRAMALPIAYVEVGPVCRIDVKPHGSADWRTGVIVTARHLWLTNEILLAVVCASEAGDLPLEEEDSDSD